MPEIKPMTRYAFIAASFLTIAAMKCAARAAPYNAPAIGQNYLSPVHNASDSARPRNAQLAAYYLKGDCDHSERAWYMRHMTRSVLK